MCNVSFSPFLGGFYNKDYTSLTLVFLTGVTEMYLGMNISVLIPQLVMGESSSIREPGFVFSAKFMNVICCWLMNGLDSHNSAKDMRIVVM